MLYALKVFFRNYYALPGVVQKRPIPALMKETEEGLRPKASGWFDRAFLPPLLKAAVAVLNPFMRKMRSQRCLRNAFSTYHALAAAGRKPVFFVGVFKAGPDLQGHSWIELDGTPWEDPENLKKFTVMFTYPAEVPTGNSADAARNPVVPNPS